MSCACPRDDALDCARARYGDTDEPCDCICHYAEDDADDLVEAEAALADFNKNGGTSLEDVKKELDI